jgi:PAS domain S-box-containing protein
LTFKAKPMRDILRRVQSGHPPSLVLALALLYFLAARCSLNLAFAGSNASPIWPPSGMALAAALLWGPRVAAGIWLGAFAANAAVFMGEAHLAFDRALWASGLIALGNLGEALVAATAFKRLRGHAHLGTPSDAYSFAAVVAVAALVSTFMGVGTLLLLDVIPVEIFGTVAFTWWLGDVTGMLVLTPLFLWLATAPMARWRALPWRGMAPALLGFGLACLAVFGWQPAWGNGDRLVCILLVLSVIWAAYRHGLGGACLTALGVVCVAVPRTLAGIGPFAKATVNDSLISLDGFTALCTLAGLVVATSARAASQQGADEKEAIALRLPSIVLVAALSLTVAAWHFISADTERRAQERFEQVAAGIANRIGERMEAYELVLEGGSGLFEASASVSKGQWHDYVEALSLQQRLPGIQGLGFAQYFTADQLQAHEQAMRASGMADYGVRPPGARPEYTSIIFLEPFNERNRRAFAYDMLSEPVRREAMSRARDTGEAALSGRVTLLQETGAVPQAGVLMYLPVYRRGALHGDMAQRRAALMGFIYAAFRMGDLMAGILAHEDLAQVYLDVHDGQVASPDTFMHASYLGAYQSYPKQSRLVRTLVIGGRPWTLTLASTPAFEAGVDTQKAQISLVTGTLISLLLFSMVRELSQRRADALALAEVMGRERAAVETRFQSLAETAGDAILVAEMGAGIDYSNGTAERMFGYEAGELIGRSLTSLIERSQRDAFKTWLIETVAAAGQAVVSKRQMQRKNGALLPVEVTASNWKVNDKRYVGLVVRDITQHITALAQLEQAKSLFSNVLDNIPAMVGMWDSELRNRYCNREYEDWFGVTAETAYGRHIREVLGEELYQLNIEHIGRALSGERVSFERVIRNHQGRSRYTQAHYLPDWQDGVVKGFFVLVFDITPLHTARQALQHNLKLHDLIFNHAGVGIALTRNRRYERVSREFTRLLGYEEGELDGESSARIFPDAQSYETMRALLAKALPEGRPFDFETFLRCKNGDPIWCHMLARAVDPQDEDEGVIWIVQDFRDRKQRQELLERARADAESAALLKSTFLANMSHEIRTPMNGIIGLTALTLESELTPMQRENLTMVQDSARSLLGLLNDILDFSKIEAGKLTLEHKPFDVRESLSTAIQPSVLVAWEKGVEFVLDVAPDVPERVWGDSLRLMQVVRNLCDNAAKFTSSGQIVCRVEHAHEDERGQVLRISVEDTGPGIPEHIKASIFDAFVQADVSVTRQYGGSGLGLTICAQIAAMMNGGIELHSKLGEGACFTFTACFSQASPAPLLDDATKVAWQGKRVGLAIVNAAARSALHRQIQAWGMSCSDWTGDSDDRCDVCLLDAALVEQDPDVLGRLRLPDMLKQGRLVWLVAPIGSPHLPDALLHRLRKPVKATDLQQVFSMLFSETREASQGHGRTAGPTDQKDERALDILLAEDHPVNQRLALRLLERQGHRVTLAVNGAIALELAGKHRFDLILMDLQMPVMDGLSATRAIRDMEAGTGRHTPIIALTAHAMKADLADIQSQGVDDYLAKPFEPKELTRLVAAVVARMKSV